MCNMALAIFRGGARSVRRACKLLANFRPKPGGYDLGGVRLARLPRAWVQLQIIAEGH